MKFYINNKMSIAILFLLTLVHSNSTQAKVSSVVSLDNILINDIILIGTVKKIINTREKLNKNSKKTMWRTTEIEVDKILQGSFSNRSVSFKIDNSYFMIKGRRTLPIIGDTVLISPSNPNDKVIPFENLIILKNNRYYYYTDVLSKYGPLILKQLGYVAFSPNRSIMLVKSKIEKEHGKETANSYSYKVQSFKEDWKVNAKCSSSKNCTDKCFVIWSKTGTAKECIR